MAKYIMIQGTTSNAGKTTICAGLCRLLTQDGYKVAPFKAQNMSSKSYRNETNGELGYGQAIQAYGCGIEPQTRMNPILLKPAKNGKIEVFINGYQEAVLSGEEYSEKKEEYLNVALESLATLDKEYEIIVIEGAGSPTEINISKPDIANMGLAKAINAPVILVGNVELGGVFASLYGTYTLLEKEEQGLIKGFIINKLHGHAELLDSGIAKLENHMNIDSYGVIPYIPLELEEEDMESRENISLKKSAKNKNVTKEELQESELDRLATHLRRHLDMEGIYKIVGEECRENKEIFNKEI